MRKPPLLTLRKVTVTLLDKAEGEARAEGNNAAWLCPCGEPVPLLARGYHGYGSPPYVIYPGCDRAYQVCRDDDRRVIGVQEIRAP